MSAALRAPSSICTATRTTACSTAPARSTSWSTRAKELGMNALALTDHGNLYGALEFYQQVPSDAGINPIVGYEAYVAPGSRFEKKTPAAARKRATT